MISSELVWGSQLLPLHTLSQFKRSWNRVSMHDLLLCLLYILKVMWYKSFLPLCWMPGFSLSIPSRSESYLNGLSCCICSGFDPNSCLLKHPGLSISVVQCDPFLSHHSIWVTNFKLPHALEESLDKKLCYCLYK